MTQNYSCAYGHVVAARDLVGCINLEGCFCPVCMGSIKGAANIIDPRLLAPVQESRYEQS